MNDAPRSYLTPADRDAAMIEASRLRAMAVRRETFDAAWDAIVATARRAVHAARQVFGRAGLQSQEGA